MPHTIKVAATQLSCVLDRTQNVEAAVNLVREAAAKGANIVLLQELFQSLYFCQVNSHSVFWIHRLCEYIFLRKGN